MSYIHFTMSGWGCRHQLDDRCLRLRKECKPGIPGCVLHGKVVFIDDVAKADTAKAGRGISRKKKSQRGPRKRDR